MSDKPKTGASVPRPTKSRYQPSTNSSHTTYILGGLAILVVAALVIFGVYWSQRDKGQADDSGLTASATMIAGSDSAPTIDLFEDPRCPACRELEEAYGPQITRAIGEGKLRVRFQTLNFLNRFSHTEYSTRAAASLLCVAGEKNTDLFLKFHTALFATQPAEDAQPEPTNADLARVAAQQGASESTQKCIANGANLDAAKAKIAAANEQFDKAGAQSTPTVLRDGKIVDLNGDWLDNILK